jgi:hypothetical protein
VYQGWPDSLEPDSASEIIYFFPCGTTQQFFNNTMMIKMITTPDLLKWFKN